MDEEIQGTEHKTPAEIQLLLIKMLSPYELPTLAEIKNWDEETKSRVINWIASGDACLGIPKPAILRGGSRNEMAKNPLSDKNKTQ